MWPQWYCAVYRVSLIIDMVMIPMISAIYLVPVGISWCKCNFNCVGYKVPKCPPTSNLIDSVFFHFAISVLLGLDCTMADSVPIVGHQAFIDPYFNGVISEGFLCGNYAHWYGPMWNPSLTRCIGVYTLLLVQAVCTYWYMLKHGHRILKDPIVPLRQPLQTRKQIILS